MIVDMEKAKSEFLKYTENYDLKDENIERKQKHSLRVMKISNKIANELKINEEKVEIATLIGLLHDIARFEQYKQYETFNDANSFDHGDYGVQILDKDMRKYIETDKYDEIIKKAVKNHNKFSIEDGLTEEKKLFAKIIRDADKIDIFYEATNIFWNGTERQIEKTKISDEVIAQFENKQQIKRNKQSTQQCVDKIICIIAFMFDTNFKESFKILRNEDYINKILNRFNFEDKETKIKMEEIRKISNTYIENKINGEK